MAGMTTALRSRRVWGFAPGAGLAAPIAVTGAPYRHDGADGRPEGWVLSRFADVVAVLDDETRFAPEPAPGLFASQDQRRRLARLVPAALTPHVMAAIADRLAPHRAGDAPWAPDPGFNPDPGCDAGPAAQAAALALAGLGEVLGVPVAARAAFADLAHRLAPLGKPMPAQAVDAFATALIAEKRARPGPDLVSAALSGGVMRVVDRDGGGAPDEDLARRLPLILIRLLWAPLTRVLATGARLLGPDAEPGGMVGGPQRAALIDALLREARPVDRAIRIARVDARIGSARICAGERVIADLASAHRDPQVLASPQRQRAFGGGLAQSLGDRLVQALVPGAPALDRDIGPSLADRAISPHTSAARVGPRAPLALGPATMRQTTSQGTNAP